jgi:hypothetical protein
MTPTYIAAVTLNDKDASTNEINAAMSLANQTQLLLVNTKVDLVPFIDLYLQLNGNDEYDHLRISPGLKNGNTLVFVMNLEDLATHQTSGFYIFENTAYTNTMPSPVTATEVQTLLDDYWNLVLIYDQAQDANEHQYKKSRLVECGQIEQLLRDNIGGFDITNENTYNGYSLKFEQAYLSLTMGQDIYNFFAGVLPAGLNGDYMSGYTPALFLIDPHGNDMIDATNGRSYATYSDRVMGGFKPQPPIW